MESYYTPSSYPDSGNSSPRSREIDFDNPPPWEDQLNSQTSSVYKVKFMCSYGGKIQPRPHDNQLSYLGGDTKIVVVDRNIKFSALLAKVSVLCDNVNDNVSFKYQLPGEDLDALISVTNDEDLENMLQEYDRLCKASTKPARLRLFVFGASPLQPPSGNDAVVGTRNFGSEEGGGGGGGATTNRSDKERFVEALNSSSIQTPPPLAAAVVPPPIPAGNVDFLFGLEKEMSQQQQQHLPVFVGNARESIPAFDEHDLPVPAPDDKLGESDPIQKHIQDLQRLRIESQQQQQVMNRMKSDDNLTAGYPVSSAGEYYVQKFPEKIAQVTVPANVAVQHGRGYWTEKQVPTGVYMIPTPASAYGHPHPHQMVRQMTGPSGQGYYTFQRMAPPEAYHDHQQHSSAYNIVTSIPAVASAATATPQSSQLPPQITVYSEPYGAVRPVVVTSTAMEGGGYAQVPAYDNGIGRQVYYTTQGGGVMAGPPPQQQHAIGEVKPLNLETVKVVGKVTTYYYSSFCVTFFYC